MNQCASRLCALPFAQPLELDFRPLQGKPAVSLLWRWLRPWLSLRLALQQRLQQETLGTAPRRLLWIYKGSPQIGDALMDLSSRVLLQRAGFQVDLYTDPHLAKLFAADEIFSHVFAQPEQIDPAAYDLVILDSFKARCLSVKVAHLRHLPFVTMRGYFSGPEFNRTLFSFFRMHQLLGRQPDAAEVSAQALPCLFSSAADRAAVAALALSPQTVAFAIGGADPGRTYPHWDRVIGALLASDPALRIVLLGSDNGRAAGAAILAANAASADRIVNCVATYSLLQTFEIFKQCGLAVACDGGLLHVAHAAGLPTVALFDAQVSPAMRLTAANRSVALSATASVGTLPAEAVVEAVRQALA